MMMMTNAPVEYADVKERITNPGITGLKNSAGICICIVCNSQFEFVLILRAAVSEFTPFCPAHCNHSYL